MFAKKLSHLAYSPSDVQIHSDIEGGLDRLKMPSRSGPAGDRHGSLGRVSAVNDISEELEKFHGIGYRYSSKVWSER